MATYSSYRTTYKKVAPTKSELLKDKSLLRFYDEYGRIYFIKKSDSIYISQFEECHVECYVLIRSLYPKEDEDERASLFPETREVLKLSSKKDCHDSFVNAKVDDSYQSYKRVTGIVQLYLPDGLPEH